MIKNLNIPKKIYLYDEGIEGLNFKEIKEFIKKNFGRIPVKLIRLRKKIVQTRGIILDLLKTNEIFDKLGPNDKDICSIILTDKLFATYKDKSLHIRTTIFSFPSIISISGIVEGPAKPKDYYILKKRYSLLGIWDLKEEETKNKFKGRFIDYGDQRMTEVIKGYISQAIFFFMKQEPFCHRKRCRLYNSHWQEDLIYSQIKVSKFCSEHKDFLRSLKNS